MKVSLPWLQTYFDAPLPSAAELHDAFTFHAFEVEEITGEKGKEVIDVKVLPDRAADCLSHRGIARELAAILDLPLKKDPLAEPDAEFPAQAALAVDIEDSASCLRYLGAYVKGVTVGPSPAWLKEALESVGSRSINNVVDATNYVMLDIGQPLHAFDAGKLTAREGVFRIAVRGALEEEAITTLSGEEYRLPEGTLVVADAHADAAIGIAGVKGGKRAEIDSSTVDIILESANFDGTLIRRAAQKLKLYTDASLRFQNRPSPALAKVAMREALRLIAEVAGGELIGVTDAYPAEVVERTVRMSVAEANALLGTAYAAEDVRQVFDRLGFSYTEVEGTFTVVPPFERRDLTIAANLVEEVGRILGYERVTPAELPALPFAPDQARYRGIERLKDFLVERGYAEISTQSFAEAGDIELANPLQSDRPWLRPSLMPGMAGALERAAQVAPRTIGPEKHLKLFEVGNVFTKDGEFLVLALGVRALAGKLPPDLLIEHVATIEQELLEAPGKARYTLDGDLVELNLSHANLEKLGDGYAPVTYALGAYRPFSLYPAALRDIAVWTPAGTSESEVTISILKEAGEHLARLDLFDQFEKEGRVSYAFRLVFESMEKTLSDVELAPAMERITNALNARDGFSVR